MSLKFWKWKWSRNEEAINSTYSATIEGLGGPVTLTAIPDRSYFAKALNHTLAFEGIFSNHRNDSGGETMYGVTKEDARDYGYLGPMKNLQLPTAEAIYFKKYWEPCNLTRVAQISQEVANEVFDTGVNMGIGRNREMLQRGINLFNRNEKNYKNLQRDGQIGEKTLQGLTYIKGTGELKKLVMILNLFQGYKYIEFCEANETQEIFFRGWFKRVFKEWNK